MRKNVVIIGAVVLVIGVVLFFVSPYFVNSALNLNALFPLKYRQTLGVNQNATLTTVKPGQLMTAVYNDTANVQLAANSTGGQVATENLNGTYALEVENSLSSPVSVYVVNNYTAPLTVYYSYESASFTTLLLSVGSMVAGIFLAIAGAIVALVGFFLRPKPKAGFSPTGSGSSEGQSPSAPATTTS